jgi:hypothetical protein
MSPWIPAYAGMTKKMIVRPLPLTMLSLSLWGCCNIEYWSVGPNEYLINGRAVFGALGEGPSPSRLAGKASALYPAGYDRLSERTSVFEGTVIDWRIRCR